MALGNLTKKGLGAAGGALMGGAGLIGSALVTATGAGKYLAGGAAIVGGAKAGANWLSNKTFNRSNTAGDVGLTNKSEPSEVEQGEVTILDKILQETDNLVNIVKDKEVPESTKRELQLAKDVQHKELISAFNSVTFSGGDEEKKEKKKSKLGQLLNLKQLWEILKTVVTGWVLILKPFFGLLRMLWRFAGRMLLFFASPAFLGIAAALLIMTNWKSIKKKAIKWINSIKSMLNKIPGINIELTPEEEEPLPETPIDAGEFDDPTFILPNVEGEPGIEPTGPEEFDVYEQPEIEPDANEFLGQDLTTVTFTPEELESQGKTIDDAGRIVSAESIVDQEAVEATFDGRYWLGDDELQSMMSDKQIKDQWSNREIQTQTLMSRIIEKGYFEDDEYYLLSDLLKLGHGLDTYDVNKLSPAFYDAINEGNRGRMDRDIISGYVHKRDPRDELQDYLDKNSSETVQQGAYEPAASSAGGAAPTAPQIKNAQGKQQKRKGDPTRQSLPTGMFAASYAPAKSTGLSWLDKLYAKDASMRYEKSFKSAAGDIKKVEKRQTVIQQSDNSVFSKSSSSAMTTYQKGYNISNSSSVATVSNK